MNVISTEHLDALALGFAILGSGGGSNPEFGKQLAKAMLSTYGPVRLVSVNDLEDDALIIPVSFMGAPLIKNVQKPSGQEFSLLLSVVEKHFQRKPTALCAAEIGGSNGFSPLLCSSALGIPVIDGDTIGRAFPELTMATTTLFNVSSTPAFLASAYGSSLVTIHKLHPDVSLETIARQLAITFGSKAAIVSDSMTGKQAKKACIQGSYTKAFNLGTIILQARHTETDPFAMLVKEANAQIVASGVITELARNLDQGFVVGYFTMVTESNDTLKIYFKNENLIVLKNGKPIATTPDIIMPLAQEDAQPLTVELLEKNKNISLLLFQGDTIWKTPQGLSLVGPQAFGFDCDYIRNFS